MAAGRYDLEQLRALARNAGMSGSDVNVAAAVAMAESGGDPNAHSSTGDYGLWQINARSWPQFDTGRLYDPSYNAAAMAIVARTGRGWGHWTTYRNGAYRRHLNAGDAQAAAGGILPDPVDVLDFGVDAITSSPSEWVDRLVGNAGKLMLGLLIATAGLALAAVGVARLSGADDRAKQLVQLGGTAAAVTGGGAAGGALALT